MSRLTPNPLPLLLPVHELINEILIPYCMVPYADVLHLGSWFILTAKAPKFSMSNNDDATIECGGLVCRLLVLIVLLHDKI